MKIALFGKAGAGTPELFAAITGREASEHKGARPAAVKVPDARVDALAEIWNPKKKIYVEATFVDVSIDSLGTLGESLNAAASCEAIIQVASASAASGGDPDPLRDIADLASEFVLRDQMVVEKRLERIVKANQKSPERELLERVLAHLETGQPLRLLGLDAAQRGAMSGYAFLSDKPLLVAVNVDEDRATAPASAAVIDAVRALGGQCLSLCISLEAEIARLDESEQVGFLEEAGLKESARARFLRAAYELLDLMTFLTMGEDECRAWSVERGAVAPEAARRIHSDIARGFIRVEVIPYADFMELRSEAACRKAGKMRVEGKEYIVQEGDILHFRFNV
ncbi:MAG: DUF933 domain-containing protein [Pseudomonadota bacterium]